MTKLNGFKIAALSLILAMTGSAAAQTFSPLLSFEGAITGTSTGPLIQGVDGSLYSSGSGGVYGNGTIFKITPGAQLIVLYNFCAQSDCPDGAAPGQLVLGTDGNFYGAAAHGGSPNCEYDCGTLFKLTPNGQFSILYEFSGPDGCNPFGALVEALDGSFYGTTVGCGTNGGGTVFNVTRQGRLRTVYNFCAQPQCSDGDAPTSTLALGSDGNLYGITAWGGTGENCYSFLYFGCGTAFRVTPTGSLTTLYSFCSVQPSCADGYEPYSAPLLATNENLYGVTETTAYGLTPSGRLTTLYTFCSKLDCADGSYANGVLDEGTDKNLYGVTAQGGSSGSCGSEGCGTIFQITRTDSFAVLHSFDGTDGAKPWGGLFEATNGKFYGTATTSGAFGYGTLFSLDAGLGPFVAFVRPFGKVGQIVQILGQGFNGTSEVSFNGIPAKFEVRAGTFLTATVPPGATTGYVTVTTPTGVLTSNVPFRVVQ